MKIMMFIVCFTVGCVGSAYSQVDQNSKGAPANIPQSTYNIKPVVVEKFKLPALGFNNLHGQFLPKYSERTSSEEATAFAGNMPCHNPVGNFSMIIVTPDTTTRYTMLIK